jgi:hypothetical protein
VRILWVFSQQLRRKVANFQLDLLVTCGLSCLYSGDPNEGIEVAKQSTQGFGVLGGAGFNTPSLLGLAYHAPYLHDGSAQTLQEVFAKHTLPDGDDQTQDATIDGVLSQRDLYYLRVFLLAIDDDTQPFQSVTDEFINALTWQ